MILIGMGANLSSERHGSPRRALEAAARVLAGRTAGLPRRSRWYRSSPVPPSDQPWFVNGVVEAETPLKPERLLELLHDIEAGFGRVREARDEPRVLDLDLLAYHDEIRETPEGLMLPHPRLEVRAFVLRPLADIAPDWVHPVSRRTLSEMLADLPGDQVAEPI